eukprot:364681-Chlamydomonas_euryale.AAC.12
MRLPIGTAAYMSPQLTECAARLRPGGCYDGAKADVWACGVTLFAMLHGAFPFEGDPGGGPSCCGGDGGPTWRTRHADVSAGLHRLSPAVVDLLDRMLDVDEASRASLDDVAAHEWLAAPLPTNMTAALDAAAAEQASKQGVTTEWAAEDLGTAGQAASEGGAEDATGSSGAGVASTGGGHVCVNASISAMVREAGQPPPRPRHAPGCGGNGHSSAAMPRWLELLPSGGASVGHRPARRAAGSLNSSGSNTSNGSNVGSGSNSGTTGSLNLTARFPVVAALGCRDRRPGCPASGDRCARLHRPEARLSGFRWSLRSAAETGGLAVRLPVIAALGCRDLRPGCPASGGRCARLLGGGVLEGFGCGVWGKAVSPRVSERSRGGDARIMGDTGARRPSAARVRCNAQPGL